MELLGGPSVEGRFPGQHIARRDRPDIGMAATGVVTCRTRGATGNPNGANLLDWPAYSANSAPVQLLEPASSGARTSPAEAYQAEHKLRFWESLK